LPSRGEAVKRQDLLTPFYGLDLASGKRVWEYEAASPVTSSPAVAKGKVVVATADGQVICFG